MRRHVARFLLALVLGTIPMAFGVMVALTVVPAGRRLLARAIGDRLSAALRGSFVVGAIEGSFVRGITLERVEVRDTSGELLATLPRAEVSYTLANLLAGRVVLSHVRVERPRFMIVKHANGRLNFQEVLKLNEAPPGTKGVSPLIQLHNLEIVDGTLEIRLPWSPPDTAITPQARAAALALDRARPGRAIVETRDGLRRLVILSRLNARLPLLSVSTPNRTPLSFRIDSVATSINDPAVTLTSLQAEGWTHDDSLGFKITRATLPASTFSGGGIITFPHGPLRYDFSLDGPRVDLKDLRWINANFPDLTGSAKVTARWRTDTRIGYAIRELHLSRGAERIDGSLTAVTDNHRGLGFEGLSLRMTQLDLDDVRPYLDTLPLEGTLTGTLKADGYFSGMRVDFDWAITDSRVAENATSTIAADGHVILVGPRGLVFDTLSVRSADIELETVRLIVPAIIVKGRLGLTGTLSGPWRDVTFTGLATHHDGDRPESAVDGLVYLDTRTDTLHLATDLQVSPLIFDGIRNSFPTLRTRGALRGTFRSSGTLEHLRVDAELQGEIGAVRAEGMITLLPPRWGADSLSLAFRALDLNLLRGTGPSTELNGSLLATGVVDTLVAPSGDLRLELSRGSVRELAFDTLYAQVGVHDSLIQVDTVLAGWRGGRLDGRGALGWAAPHAGQVLITAQADSLSGLDPLLYALAGLAPDTGAKAQPLDGQARARLALSGSLEAMWGQLEMTAHDLRWNQVRSPEVTGTATMVFGGRTWVDVTVAAESISVGRWSLQKASVAAGGFADSLEWSGGLTLARTVTLGGAGRWRTQEAHRVLMVDSLSVTLPNHPWRLAAPVEIAVGDSSLGFTPLALDAADGSGGIRLAGRFPRRGRGEFDIGIEGLALSDVYSLLQFDTTGVTGTLAADLVLGGTADAPTLQGAGSLADANFGEFGSPFVQGVVDYAEHKLEVNLLLWKTGQQVLQLEAHLPLDLALHAVPHRQLPGPLSVRAVAHNTDLGVVEAFTPAVRRVRGLFNADAEITGTWDSPRLAGFLELVDGAAVLPALNIQLAGINGRAQMVGDSITLDSLTIFSGDGRLAVSGGIRLEGLTRPNLNLTLQGDHFRAIDVRNFLSLDATGQLRLTGPIFGARLTGRLTADKGDLHFADLLTKRIVDLENPGDSSLIDLGLVREQKLGAAFQNRFLDSLTIEDLPLQMGESFWLRSGEANIQLDGTLTINRARGVYRNYGTLTAVRGNYALKLSFVTRDFVVERGTVRFFGTPDLNADLDIQARHTVHPVEGDQEIPVIASITGTLLAPKLSLESTQRPPLSETELVSYLMFGRPTFSFTGPNVSQQNAALQTGLSYVSSALSSEIQRTLITDLGIPIDYFDIRALDVGGHAGPTGQTGVTQAQVAAGWQIGSKWFVTLNADLCSNLTRFYPNAEYRISRAFRLSGSVEPTQTCTALRNDPALATTNKYQIGFDLLWEREF